MSLQKKFINKDAKLAVIGLGYVGLPLAMEYVRAGFEVYGLDLDADKVAALNAGTSYIIDIDSATVKQAIDTGKFMATTDSSILAKADSVNICVPTPLSKTQDPDISYIQAAVGAIQENMHSDMLVILESTTYPGTCEEVILPLLSVDGREVGRDYHLAFSPERVDPGNPVYQTKNIPKVVGGVTPSCTEMAKTLYEQVMDTVVPVSTARVAETVKLLENTFRSVNIAMVNEIALMCDSLGIDVWEVIDAASSKPFGFMPFYPGPGLGGHCIPIDPFYLSWKAKQTGTEARFIELAGYINSNMPKHVVRMAGDALNDHCKSLKGSKVLVVGVAYKPNIDDVRESPALDIIKMLADKGVQVSWYDPFVADLSGFEYAAKLNDWSKASLAQFDLALIATPHKDVDHKLLIEADIAILDTRNALKGIESPAITRL
jgi:UDP-N-acetyl-D-glucosamine dehydrogenase